MRIDRLPVTMDQPDEDTESSEEEQGEEINRTLDRVVDLLATYLP